MMIDGDCLNNWRDHFCHQSAHRLHCYVIIIIIITIIVINIIITNFSLSFLWVTCENKPSWDMKLDPCISAAFTKWPGKARISIEHCHSNYIIYICSRHRTTNIIIIIMATDIF